MPAPFLLGKCRHDKTMDKRRAFEKPPAAYRALSSAPLAKPAPAIKKPAASAPSKLVAPPAPIMATDQAKTSTQRMQALGRLLLA